MINLLVAAFATVKKTFTVLQFLAWLFMAMMNGTPNVEGMGNEIYNAHDFDTFFNQAYSVMQDVNGTNLDF